MSAGARSFGLWTLSFLVVANMVGAGVFTTSGFTLAALGTPGRVMAAWVVGGLIAICGAISYGQLVRAMPDSGGEYLFLSRAAHPLLGFVGGWVSLIAGFTGAIALAATALESYLLLPDWLPQDSVAITLVLLAGLLHGLGPRWGAGLQNIAVVSKLGLLSIFVGIAFRSEFEGGPLESPGDFELGAFAQQLVWISLSYSGFNAAVYVASESAEASRIVPKALLVGTALVTLLYLVLNAIFVTSAAPKDLIWQEDVAAISARNLGGPWHEMLVRCAVILGLLSSVSGMILSGPRVYAQMADDGVFPRFFTVRKGGIKKSVVLQTALAVVLILIQRVLVEFGILSTSFLGLLIYLGTTLSISSALCVATLFLPSVRAQDPHRPAWVTFLSAVYVCATFLAVVLLVANHEQDKEWRGMWHISGAVLTFGTGMAAWYFFRNSRRETSNSSNE